MKFRCRIFLLLLTALLCLNLCMGVSAEGETPVKPDSEAIRNALLQYELAESGAASVQEWLDGAICKEAGISAEWMVIALAQSGETYDFSAYECALNAYLATAGTLNSATRQKYALTLAAIGSGDVFIRTVLDETIGSQGIMTWIYGLQLLNNGYTSVQYTAEEVLEHLLSARLPDGGWAIAGSTSDVDVTAMALQALAPDREREDVRAAIGGALAFLSQQQLPDGDFAGFGSANAESTAQVLIALCELQINPFTDADFLKNGNSVLHGLLNYRLQDGSFCHTAGGEVHSIATEQAFLALTALQRYEQGKSGIYRLDLAVPERLQAYPVSSESSSLPDVSGGNTTEPDIQPTGGGLPVTVWISIALVAVGAAVCLIFFFGLKKKRVGDYLAVLAVIALAILLTCTVRIQAPGTHDHDMAGKGNAIGTVTITVRCDTVVGKSDAAPANGVMLEPVSLTLGEADTVLTLLREAAQVHGFPVDSSSGYVRAIGSLGEFDFGDLSGWVYRVNGKIPTVGSREYRPKDGDWIEWLYTCELGKDVS